MNTVESDGTVAMLTWHAFPRHEHGAVGHLRNMQIFSYMNLCTPITADATGKLDKVWIQTKADTKT